jgi:hypothetical protein
MTSATNGAASAGFSSSAETSFADFGKDMFKDSLSARDISLPTSAGKTPVAPAMSFKEMGEAKLAMPAAAASLAPDGLFAQPALGRVSPSLSLPEISPIPLGNVEISTGAMVAQASGYTVGRGPSEEPKEFQNLEAADATAMDRLWSAPAGTERSFVVIMENSRTGTFMVDGAYDESITPTSVAYEYDSEWTLLAVYRDENGAAPGLR